MSLPVKMLTTRVLKRGNLHWKNWNCSELWVPHPLCVQCLCSLLPLSSLSPGQDIELSTWQGSEEERKKSLPSPEEWMKGLHFCYFCCFPYSFLLPGKVIQPKANELEHPLVFGFLSRQDWLCVTRFFLWQGVLFLQTIAFPYESPRLESWL